MESGWGRRGARRIVWFLVFYSLTSKKELSCVHKVAVQLFFYNGFTWFRSWFPVIQDRFEMVRAVSQTSYAVNYAHWVAY